MITAIYRDGESTDFPVSSTKIGWQGERFLNGREAKPVRFVVPAGLTQDQLDWLRICAYPNYDDKVDVIVERDDIYDVKIN